MSLAVSSCRQFSERLRQSHVVDQLFRVGTGTHASIARDQNISNRNHFCRRWRRYSSPTLPAEAGPAAVWSSTSSREYHATNSFSSLRQDAHQPPHPPRHPWIVKSSDDELQSSGAAGPGGGHAHDALESTPPEQDIAPPNRVASPRAMILDGRECGAQWLAELVPTVEDAAQALGRPPGLCVIHVGERRDSQLYVSKKEDACKEMKINSTLKHLPTSTSQEQLHAVIDAACADDAVDGVLVQLPLPTHLNEFDVMERLDPRKDVDGFHPLNMGRMLARNAPPRFIPATALGCMQLLKMYNISVTKKHVVVVGDSNIVGTPLSVLLRDAGAGTVTVCHRIAYTNIFEDRLAHGKSRQLRSHAHACLPRLPGPYSPVDATAQSLVDSTKGNEAAQMNKVQATNGDSRRPCSPDAARVTVVQKADATTIIVEATDRPGLLKSLASVFCDLDLNVRHADVQTCEDGRRIRDIFELTDVNGAPVQDARTLRRLSALVRQHVGGVVIAEPGTWDDRQLAALTRTADVLVVAVGYPELVKGDWVKPGAVVLDVGINVVPVDDDHTVQSVHKSANPDESSKPSSSQLDRKQDALKPGDGRVVGDVAFKQVVRLASAVTPVPGGVGPMTIAALIHNVVLAAQYRAGLKQW